MNEQNLGAGTRRKFFSKIDWAAFWSATIAAFLVYFFTLGPSVGLEDSGELATAADHLGVPHPPGYPFWTLCGWIFCRLFSWVTYMGHPTPAWAMSLFSAVTGAFAAGCTAMLVCRSSMDMMQQSDDANDSHGKLTPNSLFAFSGGVGAALVFAFSPVMWSQSTIVEVYSLNALFLMWVFLLSYRWMKQPSDKILWLTAFVFGLGLTNYQVLLLAAVPIAVIIALKDLKLFRDTVLILIPIGLTYMLLKIGCMLRANAYMSADVINKFEPVLKTESCPNEIFLWAGCACVAVAPFVRRAWRQIGFTGVGLVLLAATVFAGQAEWNGAHEQLVAPLLNPAKYAWIGAFLLASAVCSLGFAFNTEKKDWRWIGAAGACGLIALIVAASGPSADAAGYRGVPYSFLKANILLIAGLTALFALVWKTPRGLAYAVPVAAVQLTTFVLLEKGSMNGLTNPHSWWFIWPIIWNFLVLGLAFVALPNGRSMAVATFLAELGVSFYAYMPIVSDLRNPPMNWGYPRTWEGFKHAITRGQYEAIKMGDVFSLHFLHELGFYVKDLRTQFTAVLMAVALASFPLGHIFTRKEHRRTWYSWLAGIGSCFLVMSVLLIALANTKGDVQDGFIQKVKFISSHGMFALWIGYGLVFGAKFAVLLWNRLFNKATRSAAESDDSEGSGARIVPKWLIHLLCLLMLSTSLIPIYENYTNDRLVFELGSAEQNGHTFGWQFGAWQLDGAEEIRDELLADEEPLPNPLWPPSMEPHSIFFGGTDPGRFVPTYMIYSANFRPDVYLITQNALADDTYMSVERDLYGDEIWIPSKEDSAESFQVYVEEVQSGKRNANADLKIENGRVQVTGALGVMEINGILTKMMFDHERLRHAFYVEESYVIQWMYPYLSPHGLIMKINKDKNPLTPQILQNDEDFWDWYVRRLLKDKAFRRDFPAQKSFSKLRAAIAGLYSHTGRYREAEQAFREAVLLYPASPEASFRYIQEVLMPMRKWNVVEDILDYTDRVDPNNSRVKPMRGYMERMRQITEQISMLQAKVAKGQISATESIILAGCYLQLGQTAAARGFTKKALESKDINFECLYRGAQIYAQCGQRGDAAQAAKRALDRLPPNAPPHLRKDLAMTLVEGGMTAEANAQLNEYLRVQPKDAEAWLAAAVAKDALSQVTEAQRAIIQAYQCDASLTMDRIRQNETLQRIAAPLFRRK